MSPEERAARSRHPAWRWSPDHDGLRRRMAARLAAEGHPWPEMAATLVAVRGRIGTDVSGLAGMVGADSAMLAAVEMGDPAALPRAWVDRRRLRRAADGSSVPVAGEPLPGRGHPSR